MAKKTLIDQLRGATTLAIEATRSVTDIVEAMHRTIGAGPNVLGRPLEKIVKVVTAPTYGAIRGVTGLVGSTLDLALSKLAPVLDQAGLERSAVLSALNGVMGDYLAETGNPLAIEMQLLARGVGDRIAVLVHGSSMNDEQWRRAGHDHGAELAKDLGFAPVYALYNSGLHVSVNGRLLSAALEQLVTTWPSPVTELVLIGHSMGGLVMRSAFVHGEGSQWRRAATKVVTLGTPHHGSPLERLGNLTDVLLTVSRYSAPLARLGQLRSAGVTDLRYGNVLDEHWEGKGRFEPGADARSAVPLPPGVKTLAIAGDTGSGSDGLVPVDSALGRHASPALTLAFTETWVASNTTHLALLSSEPVYERLRDFLKA